MRNEFFQIFLFFGLLLAISANATTCSKSYTLGFFNGVWNTDHQADLGLKKLKDLVGITYNNEPVNYETFYNHTGPGYDVLGLQDLAETFIQRSAEIDASGELGKRFEYFWEFLGSSEPTFLDKLTGFLPNAASLFDSLYTAINTKLVAIISYFTSNPPTEADYATHNARLDTLAANGEKLMLVAHSQGNLFVNHAYDHVLPVVTKNRVAVAHIAPASPTLRGDYVLADIDIVINAMRLQGINSVPDVNLTLPFSKADASGHTLIGTYLDGTRDGRAKIKTMIKTMIETAMGKLTCYKIKMTTIIYGGTTTSDILWWGDCSTPEYNIASAPYRYTKSSIEYLPIDSFGGQIPKNYSSYEQYVSDIAFLDFISDSKCACDHLLIETAVDVFYEIVE